MAPTATPTAMPAMVLVLRPLVRRAWVLDRVGLAVGAAEEDVEGVFSATGVAETVLMEMMVDGGGGGGGGGVGVGRMDVSSVDGGVVDSVEDVEEVVLDVVEVEEEVSDEDEDVVDEEEEDDVEGAGVVAAGCGGAGGGVAVAVSEVPC